MFAVLFCVGGGYLRCTGEYHSLEPITIVSNIYTN
jgi:hypothetical protein